MAHIKLSSDAPGIVGLLNEYPETGKPLRQLAQQLLRGPSSLSEGEREIIASFVSSENACEFCQNSHGAAAEQLLSDQKVMKQVWKDYSSADISAKMKALLNIAKKVQNDGKSVTERDIEKAGEEGADEKAIHDTVLIAAAFCMYNRYVDGLNTKTPSSKEAYKKMGKRLAEEGYGKK